MSITPNSGERGRFSSQRKTASVLRLLRGEDLELVSRELGVTVMYAGMIRKGYVPCFWTSCLYSFRSEQRPFIFPSHIA